SEGGVNPAGEGRRTMSSLLDPLPTASSPDTAPCIKPRHALEQARALLVQPEPDFAQAVPLLMVALRHRDLHARAVTAELLACLGPAAVPALIDALEDEDIGLRKAVIVTLGKIGPEAAGAVPRLLPIRDDEELGESVAKAIDQIQPDRCAMLLAKL